ncbi:putative transcription factor C2H2 family [Helianthus annuus]|uniref:RING-type E3 ubiquitin transferase n=1 Tax=Helianthus annuus TaxID=4232 RepID=A0A251S4T5_HELAN|nr:probable E3 ubiquitin-protein ligase BAH1-like 1 [Helianthus annuus]KAF5762863.1 putative transcription factor C2H2 family [Helianthus annuus]KAJ0471585.1 putative transcription factor C2H2 family [Helianthus annuus]KAJ0647215.1 putative transcription factor C2H2 family [Helianthus annuus]KAJ0691728.1 putative transcription factor C2H2 family [Helianthus annuus]
MKFCKKYEEYMQTHDQKKLPGVGFKNLKKILKRCRSDVSRSQKLLLRDDDGNKSPSCVHHCAVCDGSFFPSLTKEMSMVVGCFNECAQKVLDVHLASGFRKYFLWCTDKLQRNHGALIQEGKDLVGYAIINAIAMRKILKKYDKIHDSKQGQAFRSQVQSMHMEILQSPWLYELIAFHINLRERKGIMGKDSKLFEGCGIIFNDGKPSLSCELSHAVKLEIDLTCSICLETVFDPVCLTCGHIFCFMCACKSASVTIVDGLKAAEPTAKCPLCREARVYHGSLHLDELNILLSRSCPEYWEERLQTERVERIRQTKEHWEAQSRSFLGI